MNSRSVSTSLQIYRSITIIWAGIWLAACASSYVLVGKPRAPISPDQVTIYSQPPGTYEYIARLASSSRASMSFGDQAKSDKVIERLKKEAAKLGANGVLLEHIKDEQSGSIGAGAGGSSASGNSSVGVGAGGSIAIYQKVGVGWAIYVVPD